MRQTIFTDGSCLDHGKDSARGGWSYVVCNESATEIRTESYGKLRVGKQTNNRAELEAMLQALLWIDSQDGGFYTIYADSETVIDGMNGDASRSANRDIWRQVEVLCARNVGRITVKSIESHLTESEDPRHQMNCYADKLAKKGAQSLLIAPIETNL